MRTEDATYVAARKRMLDDQLSSRGIINARVLEAMGRIPRQEFVPSEERPRAYDDRALSIGFGQTISQPYVVAFMTEQLDPQPSDRLLEIGTGSGYQTAILAALVEHVYTIEILQPLAELARAALEQAGGTNVSLRVGDGYQGWREAAPFDGIIVTCAPEAVPLPLMEQLRDGGLMIIPVGPHEEQNLILLHKHGQELEQRSVLPVRFVPMTGQAQQ